MPEIWRTIKGLEPYECSDEGQFRRIFKNGKVSILTPYRKWEDPSMMVVKIKNIERNARRVVWETFKGPIPPGYVIRTKNGMQTATAVYDLEMVPTKVAQSDAAKRRAYKIKDLDTGKVYRGTREAADKLFMSRTNVYMICRGMIKKPCARLVYIQEE